MLVQRYFAWRTEQILREEGIIRKVDPKNIQPLFFFHPSGTKEEALEEMIKAILSIED